ncbi:unnamed protein product [Anisakis simplex]|uniref:BZIP domain-containing protein n=1 Tax=Anisakis simplex TaxID=6269 RepID=A0A0M3JYA2_ANISI|nr:unnamed protein product [Anisakis simplex]
MESVMERDDSSVDVVTLETPNLANMVSANSASLPGDFPSTAELMQKCLAVNPFELKFREANRQFSQGNQELLEQNGLVPATLSLPTSQGITLLKLPTSLALEHSPGIFSNINFPSADLDGENYDFARLLQHMKDNGGLSTQSSRIDNDATTSSGQAPRTADVLNAVLDMHSDRLSSFNYLGSGGNTTSSPLVSCSFLSKPTIHGATPGGTIPSTAAIAASLASAAASVSVPTTSSSLINSSSSNVLDGNVSAIPSVLLSPSCSSTNSSSSVSSSSCVAASATAQSTAVSQAQSASSSTSSNCITAPIPSLQPLITTNSMIGLSQLPAAVPVTNAALSTASALTTLSSSATLLAAAACSSAGLSSSTTQPLSINVSSPSSATHHHHPMQARTVSVSLNDQQQYFDHEEVYPNAQQQDAVQKVINEQQSSQGPRSVESEVSIPSTSRSGGRGRGRTSLTADLPPDERRVTILERNKAAAVRYRKRKKEEHDEMITRVQMLEQEKNALTTQNQVLRRELERVTALLKAYESRCVCRLTNMNEVSLRSDSPVVDVDVLSSPNNNSNNNNGAAATYLAQQPIVNALHVKKLSK